jgi:pilus assembly protein CpaE
MAAGAQAGQPAAAPVEGEEPLNALAVVNDATTAETLAAIFDLVGNALVRVGDLNLAAEVVAAETECPPLLVLDLAGSDDPVSQLEQIAQICPAGTGVVLVGDSDDPMLHHELQAMGVAHYLLKPVHHNHLLEAIRLADPSGLFEGAASGQNGQLAADEAPAPEPAPAAPSSYIAKPKAAPAPRAPAPANSSVRVVANQPARESVNQSVAAAVGLPAAKPRPVRAPAAAPPAAVPEAAGASAAQPAPSPYGAPVPLAEVAPAAGSDPISRRVLHSYSPVNTMQDAQAAVPGALGAPAPDAPPVANFSSVTTLPDVEPLPRHIDLMAFVTDDASASLITSLIAPYGTEGRVLPGNVETAVTMLQDIVSPKLLIIDISGVGDPMPMIDQLAEVCAPGTSVLVIGDTNDVSLYRDLKAAGVSDYAVKPLQADSFTGTILNCVSGEAEKAADPNKPVVFVIGARGGIGSSTLAISLGGELVNRNKRVVLVDLDLQYGSIALALDTQPGQGLREVLESPDRLDSMFLNSMTVKVSENLFILAGEEGVAETIMFHQDALAKLIAELTQHYDAVVVDLPRTIVSSNWTVLSLAHYVLVLSDLSLVGIRDTSRLIAAAKGSIDAAKIKLVLSGSGHDGAAKIDRKEFEAVIKAKVDYVLPHDARALTVAHQAARPVVNVAGGSKLAESIRSICSALFAELGEAEVKKSRSFFWRRKRESN